MLPPSERKKFLKKMRAVKSDALKRAALFVKIQAMGKKIADSLGCPSCGAPNGLIKKTTTLRLFHDRFRSKKSSFAENEFRAQFREASSYNKEILQFIPKAAEDLSTLMIKRIFEGISSEDVELLNMDPLICRPENLILTHLLIPPAIIRPTVNMDSQLTNEDDLTARLSEIILANQSIHNEVTKGTPISQIMEQWDYLQSQVALFINSEAPGIEKSGKELRGIAQRLKGKTGRFRGNLSGKVHYSFSIF